MKLSTMPVALAAVVGLASTAAHAQLAAPTIGSAAPALTGLYVSIWDTSTSASELVNLSYLYSDLTTAGALTPDSVTGAYKSVTNPTGASGSVLQLDFGVLPGFSSTFSSVGSTTDYMVVAQSAQPSGALFTESSASQAAQLTASALTTLQSGISGEAANWENNAAGTGTAIDTNGTTNYSAINGPNKAGTNGLNGYNFSGNVGTALNFFNLVPGSSRGTVSLSQFSNSQGAGFWFLSSTGDLSWNVLEPSSVPLPAAVWLFVSGLAGLGAIGRRRAVAA